MNENIIIRRAKETSEGEHVEVKRLFPIQGYMNFDPFVLWDHFNVQAGSGFPDHPHRGFEAITYMFSGSMKHTDNLGNDSRVLAGGAQRFTAGKGIVHSEMPGSEGANDGIQLWINLPKSLKTLEPAYQEVLTENIPVKEFEGGASRIIVGEGSPLKLHTSVEYEDVSMNSGAMWNKTIKNDIRGILYVVSGEVEVAGKTAKTADAVMFSGIESISIKAISNSRFMLCVGKPHGEPIKQWGPYVD